MKAASVWRRQGNALIPWSAEARDALAVLNQGDLCVAELTVSQRPHQLAQYWTLVRVVADGVGMIPDRVSDLLKLELGLYEPYVDRLGCIKLQFYSLSPQSIDAVDFEAFMKRAIVIMAEKVGAAKKDVRREFMSALRSNQSER